MATSISLLDKGLLFSTIYTRSCMKLSSSSCFSASSTFSSFREMYFLNNLPICCAVFASLSGKDEDIYSITFHALLSGKYDLSFSWSILSYANIAYDNAKYTSATLREVVLGNVFEYYTRRPAWTAKGKEQESLISLNKMLSI